MLPGLVELSVPLVMGMLSKELPGLELERYAKVRARWEESVTELATIIEEETRVSLLVSPKVDFALMGAILYRESRWRTWVWDGDCRHPEYGHRINTDRGPAPDDAICRSTGPFQIAKSWTTWARTLDGLEALERDELSQATPNARVAYHLLNKARRECGGPPAVWLTAWRWGRCPTELPDGTRYIEPEARARCELARQIHEGLDGRASEWACVKTPQRPDTARESGTPSRG